MQLIKFSLLALILMAGTARAREAPAPADAAVRGQLTAASTKLPIALAKVNILRNGVVVAKTKTDADGHYRASLAPGVYEIRFEQGRSQLTRQFEARAAKVARVNGRMTLAEGEVIVIRERRKARRALAKNFNPRRNPPYSDRVITSNRWAKAWLLLDVDTSGTVTRLKFINRPGYDLDDIAAGEAFKLEFTPSLNEDGKPIKTLVVWSIEWPAFWWLIDRTGSAASTPSFSNPGTAGPASPVGDAPLRSSGPSAPSGPTLGGFGTGFRTLTGNDAVASTRSSIADSVPCRGSEPINLDSISPIQKDCSLPDFDKPFDDEPWIERPAVSADKR